MKRTLIVFCVAVASLVLVARAQVSQNLRGRAPAARTTASTFRLVEAGIPEMRAALASGHYPQRAAADRARVRVRAGHETAHGAASRRVIHTGDQEWRCSLRQTSLFVS
jgi:hypothetical protein